MSLTEPTFEDAVAQLRDEQSSLSKEMLFLFSDLAPRQLTQLKESWTEISVARRQEFMQNLKRELELDTLLCFNVLANSLLTDDDAFVRASAIRLLSDCESDTSLPAFLEIAKNDPETEPRAEAITALGAFVLRGELDEISKDELHTVEETLLFLSNANQKTELRQRALESLGYSSRPEVAKLIKEAWQREIPMWKASALFAMGRSSDDVWSDEVLLSLLEVNEIVRLAAVKATGELELAKARPLLLKMLEDEKDEDLFRALIWSLSQIGGEDVREYFLSLLDQYDDDEEVAIAYIEEALENLDFTEDALDFDFLKYDPDDPLEK